MSFRSDARQSFSRRRSASSARSPPACEPRRPNYAPRRRRAEDLGARAARALGVANQARGRRVDGAAQLLKTLGYRNVLDRGFALVCDAAGHPVRQAAAVAAGARLQIELADGRLDAVTAGGETAEFAAGSETRRGRRPVDSAGQKQGQLF